MLPKNVTPRLCDLFEYQCFSDIIGDIQYKTTQCKCYSSCKKIISDHKSDSKFMSELANDKCQDGEYGFDYVKSQLLNANITPAMTLAMHSVSFSRKMSIILG
jgi:hypothetical protein